MLKVGDRVTIIPTLKCGESYAVFCNEQMPRYAGKEAVIQDIRMDRGKPPYYILDIDCADWVWTEDMLQPMGTEEIITEEEEEEKILAEFPAISVPERDDTEYIERCVELEESLYEKYSCTNDNFNPYPYTDKNVRKANKVSNLSKKWLNDVFSRHPLWDNRTHSIVFSADLVRGINREDVVEFYNWIQEKLFESIPELKLDGLVEEEIAGNLRNYKNITTAFECLSEEQCSRNKIDELSYQEAEEKRREWRSKFESIRSSGTIISTILGRIKRVSTEDGSKYKAVYNLLTRLGRRENCSQFITEETAKFCEVFEENTGIKINGVVGKKTSRVINAMCVALGLNKIKIMKTTATGREYDDGYNSRYTRFSDAINPLTFKQKTVITTDRIAFLTASFGKDWSSCFTMDKNNKRCRDGSHNYSGCYSGGTTSYGTDGTSFVLYTIKNDYDGDEPVMEDKLNRCFFSLGEGKLIQSRNYPDGRDGGDMSLAKQFREIVQKVVAECFGIPNMWKNVKGTYECDSVIEYKGAGYHDHVEYDDCNVSYWKGMDGNALLNTVPITIGSESICPNCGEWIAYDECVVCEDCVSEFTGRVCYQCGSVIDPCDEDNVHYIDGEYYCNDCCFYCAYHEEWEVGNVYDQCYIQNYGYVCEDGMDSGDFTYCEECEEYHEYDSYNHVITEDDHWYCSSECAENAGYVKCRDGEWRKEEVVYYCEECGEYVLEDEYDFEKDMCMQCAAQEEDEEGVA